MHRDGVVETGTEDRVAGETEIHCYYHPCGTGHVPSALIWSSSPPGVEPTHFMEELLSTVLVQVYRGQEVIETIAREASKLGITAASISPIGAVQQATVSVMKKDQPKTDYLRDYDQPLEVTGTSEITDDGVHLHVTLAGEDLILADHLHAATVRDVFVRAYATPLAG